MKPPFPGNPSLDRQGSHVSPSFPFPSIITPQGDRRNKKKSQTQLSAWRTRLWFGQEAVQTATRRSSPGAAFGLSFQDCTINNLEQHYQIIKKKKSKPQYKINTFSFLRNESSSRLSVLGTFEFARRFPRPLLASRTQNVPHSRTRCPHCQPEEQPPHCTHH